MINSNVEKLIPEFKEVADLFNEATFFDIAHNFSCVNGEFINTFTVKYMDTVQEYRYADKPPKFTTELEEKRYIKRYAKLNLYKSLYSLTGKTLPWGALTGIRPTKLAYMQKRVTGEYKNFFSDFMMVSDKKLELVDKILTEQNGIYTESNDITDFFIGIPFCPTRCKYCSFISTDIRTTRKLIPDYITALERDIASAKELVKNLRSVYIGGGTPVALPDEYLKRLLNAIGKVDVEFTVEAGRPDCITEENLKILKGYGVTRICVNPQTFIDETLVRIGRYHTAQDVIDKYLLAKKFGFSINMDLICGLEGESVEDFKYSLNKAVSLQPDNITVHTLCLKKGSYLSNEETRLSENGINEMVDFAHTCMSENGYNPYYLYRQKYMAGNLENTGYTLKGKTCVYNVDVMEEISDNVACGTNAVSKFVDLKNEKILRYATPKDILTYVNKLDEIIKDRRATFLEIENMRNGFNK